MDTKEIQGIKSVEARLKLLMLGDSGVGKSSLLTRFTEEKFNNGILGTAGIDYRVKKTIINEKNVFLEIWDTAGQERFRTIASKYYQGAMGVILVFDVTERQSFINIHEWIGQIRQNTSVDEIALIVAGNKTDLVNRVVLEDEGKALALQYNAIYVETSAKENRNVFPLFMRISTEIMRNDKILAKNWNNTPTTKLKKGKQNEKKNCC